jgi:hypothetical protein
MRAAQPRSLGLTLPTDATKHTSLHRWLPGRIHRCRPDTRRHLRSSRPTLELHSGETALAAPVFMLASCDCDIVSIGLGLASASRAPDRSVSGSACRRYWSLVDTLRSCVYRSGSTVRGVRYYASRTSTVGASRASWCPCVGRISQAARGVCVELAQPIAGIWRGLN